MLFSKNKSTLRLKWKYVGRKQLACQIQYSFRTVSVQFQYSFSTVSVPSPDLLNTEPWVSFIQRSIIFKTVPHVPAKIANTADQNS